jgi:LysM repeat protein
VLAILLVAACSPLDRGNDDEKPSEAANESQFVIVTVTVALSPTPRLSESSYVVQEGDTLSGIAEMFGVTWDAIIQANNLQSQDAIFVGQELLIPVAATPEPEVIE